MATDRASSQVQPLIEGYQNVDPRLYDILSKLAAGLNEVQTTLFPITKVVSGLTTGAPIPSLPTGLFYSTANRQTLNLIWLPAENAASYEIRLGTVWNTASFVTRTLSTEVRLEPLLVGTYRYLLKSINVDGKYSTDFSYVDVVIPDLGSITITGQVIDNNVLLRWSEPVSTWNIDFYTIYKGTEVIGIQRGTFFVFFEATGGTFTYGIRPTDIAGNVGTISTITLFINQPSDYELLDYRISLLDQKKTNALPYGSPLLGWSNIPPPGNGWDAGAIASNNWTWDAGNTGKLLVCVDTGDTWTTHFTNEGWISPSEQVNAGFPIYIEPNKTTGQYQEVIDYGIVINNTILSLDYTLDQKTTSGTVSAIPSVEFSLDGVTWDTPIVGKNAYGVSFRYARITTDFSSTNNTALAIFSNLTETLHVKREIDSGSVDALATDASGTLVTFNKPFKDIDSITINTVKSLEPVTAIYDFVDIPNPTHFYVYAFNSIGARINAQVSWKARGIV